MKNWLQKKIYDFFYNHPLIRKHTSQMVYEVKKEILDDLCSRVAIPRMRELLDEAEKSGDKKYTTLARLMEENFQKCCVCIKHTGCELNKK